MPKQVRHDDQPLFTLKNLLLSLLFLSGLTAKSQNNILVFQSDFGQKDGAVAAMKGVALGVSPTLNLVDLTHEIPAFNVWEAAYRLIQTVPYFPKGTVFVSICDPGVGTDRRSVVVLTKSGHYIVTPDNGTLTFVAEELGVVALRQIDEKRNRRSGSADSHTFHGRDVYAFTGARLAAKTILFAQVGPLLNSDVVRIPHQSSTLDGRMLLGTIPVLDVQYGNVWSNIPQALVKQAGLALGDQLSVRIFEKEKLVFSGKARFVHTFGEVPEGEVVVYFNSLLNLSVAINLGDFAKTHRVGSGPDWRMEAEK
ncbi:MAG: S-adenosyl-l-methionine hydroxide adenosyltransferase family protein [Sphingobacteriaceae bacterium]|nr:S-adenosyl-l-methionine hydroxide adenosyltransferase family protein [Cytophagaceae bacterium]